MLDLEYYGIKHIGTVGECKLTIYQINDLSSRNKRIFKLAKDD